MAADMLDRLQENKLRGLEELIDSYQAAATGTEEQTAAMADFIVDEGIGLRQGLMHFWDYYWTEALSGEVSDRQAEGVKIRSLLERGAGDLKRAAALARKGAGLSGHEVARLDAFEEQCRTFPVWVEECLARWELLDRPRPPLDREQIARSQAAFERGECEDVADMLARLERGGPLVRE